MTEDDELAELYRIKEQLSLQFPSAAALSAAARKYCCENPSPPVPPQRKLIPNFPRGASVGDVDETMRELYEIKEKLSLEMERQPKPPVIRPRVRSRKPTTPMRKSNAKKKSHHH